MAYGMVLGQTPKSPKANEVEYSNASTSALITSNNVQGAIDQLFTSVSNGKNKIAGAITDKGVSTSGTDSFDVMVGNIGKIPVEMPKVVGTFEIPKFNLKTITVPSVAGKQNVIFFFIKYIYNESIVVDAGNYGIGYFRYEDTIKAIGMQLSKYSSTSYVKISQNAVEHDISKGSFTLLKYEHYYYDWLPGTYVYIAW